MMKSKLNEAFPIVAAALGNNLGVRVMVTGQTAWTDGEMIVIPAYDGEDPKYRDVAWGYLAHEAAHIRYTDFGVFKSACTTPIRKAILNIIEDVRIEKRMAESYPGTRFTIEKTVAQLIAEGGYEIPSNEAHPAVLLQAYLLFGLRSKVLGQTLLKGMASASRDQLKDTLTPNLFDILESVSTDVENVRNTQEALNLTDRILSLLSKDLEDADEKKATSQEASEQGESGAKSDDASAADGTELASCMDAHDDESVTESSEGSDTGTSSFLKRIMEATESELLSDVFETIREELELGKENHSGLTFPVADEPPLDPVRGRLLLDKALTDSGRLRASLQGLVQASRLSKPITRLNGNRMDAHRLCRLGLGDPKVFRRMEARKAPNTAVHILVDRSPSMSAIVASDGKPIGRRIDLAWEATLSLAIALEGIQGVNAGISAFPGKNGEASSVYAVLPHGVSIRSRVGAFGGDLDGSTPLAEAICYAGSQHVNQREDRKILLVLTDGIPDDMDAAISILGHCRTSNIEVTGIGLGIEVDRVFESCVSVQLMRDLPTRLNEICSQLLVAA